MKLPPTGGLISAAGTFLFGVPLILMQFTEIKIPFEVSKWSVIIGMMMSAAGKLWPTKTTTPEPENKP